MAIAVGSRYQLRTDSLPVTRLEKSEVSVTYAGRGIDAARAHQHAVADRADRSPAPEERGDATLERVGAQVVVAQLDRVPRVRCAEGRIGFEFAVERARFWFRAGTGSRDLCIAASVSCRTSIRPISAREPTMTLDYDPFSPRFRDDPYPAYRALRESAPVHFAPESRMFCVSRHEDVSQVLRRADLFSSSAMATVLMNADMGPMRPRYLLALARFLLKARINPITMQKRGNLVSSDPPRHDVMRKIVNRAFTPKRIEAWEQRAREIVATRLAKLARGDAFDVVEDLAVPLRVTIIAEMLGVAPERQHDFKRWSDAIIAVATGSARQNPVESGMLDGFGELYAYLRKTVRARRRAPENDLVSVLVDPSQDGVLDELDMVQFVVLLLVAGNETTTNLIGNAVHALLEHPEQLARVAADPALVPGLVEETLRYDAPIQMVFRTASCDTEIAGTPIPKGSTVVPLLGSANRDERVFDAPDRFDVGRDAKGHLAFGLGVHFCLGAALARLEARVALEGLVPLLAECEPGQSVAPFIDSFLVRGRTQLPVSASRAV